MGDAPKLRDRPDGWLARIAKYPLNTIDYLYSKILGAGFDLFCNFVWSPQSPNGHNERSSRSSSIVPNVSSERTGRLSDSATEATH